MGKSIVSLILSVFFCLLALEGLAGSEPVEQVVSKSKTPRFYILMKSIDNNNRDGVTRIAVDLQGLPNTSSRIDDVVLQHGTVKVHAVDIDGVDFNRYFQWDDEGLIPVEIDFPKQRSFSPGDSLHFITPEGKVSEAIGANVLKRKK